MGVLAVYPNASAGEQLYAIKKRKPYKHLTLFIPDPEERSATLSIGIE
ncbi:MAG: hypothetical protein ABI045_03900 [Flavobacteriales bacterium]